MAIIDEVIVLPPFRVPAALAQPTVSMQRRVQFVALLQLAESGRACSATTTAICRGADRRDLEAALIHLVEDGSVAGQTCRLDSLVTLAEAGLLDLTPLGRIRLEADAA